jgi:hypothetical protein
MVVLERNVLGSIRINKCEEVSYVRKTLLKRRQHKLREIIADCLHSYDFKSEVSQAHKIKVNGSSGLGFHAYVAQLFSS